MTLKQKPLLEHVIVKSDNLVFMTENSTALAETVDCIYIDPPLVSSRAKASDKAVRKRQHERWVDFMRPRLAAARPTLKQTGFIAASVQDREQPRLRLLMDEVFGEENFIGMVTIDTGNVTNNARLLSAGHEYLLLYARHLPSLMKSGVRWRKKREGLDALRKQEKKLRTELGEDFDEISSRLKEWLRTQNNLTTRLKQFYRVDADGVFTFSDLSAPKNGLFYEVVNPLTGSVVSTPGRGWGLSEETFHELIEHDQIIWGTTDDHQPLRKLYLKDTPDQVIRSVLNVPSRAPEKLLRRILGADMTFDEAKDLDFMKHILEVMTPDDALIFDFFAGSGTTGHAVLDINYENVGSQRRFLLCSNDEGFVFSHVLKPRIQAVISGKWADRQHRPRRALLKTRF
jgi:adenine-specific DNA-methyltransferase